MPDERLSPIPIWQSQTAERILKHLWVPFAIILASVPMSLGLAWLLRDWGMLNLLPAGMVIAGILLMLLALRDFCEHADFHPLRAALDHLDGHRDGRIFGVPVADEYTDEAESDIDLERRVRRALKAVVEQGVTASRESICRRHKMMSQREWYFWHIRAIRAGIINDRHQVLVPSAQDAFQKWDALTASKNGDRPRRLVNIGEGKRQALVLFSDLLNKQYIKE